MGHWDVAHVHVCQTLHLTVNGAEKWGENCANVDFASPGLDFIFVISPVALFRAGFSPPDRLKKNEIAGLRSRRCSAAVGGDIFRKCQKMLKNAKKRPKKNAKKFSRGVCSPKKVLATPESAEFGKPDPDLGGVVRNSQS